jgi:hypothetical protein
VTYFASQWFKTKLTTNMACALFHVQKSNMLSNWPMQIPDMQSWFFSTKANMTSSTKLFQYGNRTHAYKLYVNIWLCQMDSIIIIDMNPLTKNLWDIPRNPPLLHQFFGLICILKKTKIEVGDTCICFFTKFIIKWSSWVITCLF